jgi:hypothetical protein
MSGYVSVLINRLGLWLSLLAAPLLLGACARNPVFAEPGGLKTSESGTVSGMVAKGVYDNTSAEKTTERELTELRNAAVDAANAWAEAGMPSPDDARALSRIAKFRRDRYASRMLAYIDEYHEQTMNAEYYTAQTVKGIGQLASVASAFIATVAGAETTKSVFAGVSTVLQGAGATVDEQFLQKHSMLTIQAECTINRLETRNVISARLKGGIDGYSVEELDADLTTYFHAGSVVNALITLSSNAQSRLAGAKLAKRSFEMQSIDDETIRQLRNNPGGKPAPPK